MFLYNLLWNSDVKCEQNVDIKPKVYQGRQWRSTGSQVCALWTRTADLLIFWGPISPPWKAHAHVGSISPGKQSADKKMQGGKTPTSASLLWRNMSHPRVVPAPSVLPIRLYRGHDIPRTSAKSVCGMAKKKKAVFQRRRADIKAAALHWRFVADWAFLSTLVDARWGFVQMIERNCVELNRVWLKVCAQQRRMGCHM